MYDREKRKEVLRNVDDDEKMFNIPSRQDCNGIFTFPGILGEGVS